MELAYVHFSKYSAILWEFWIKKIQKNICQFINDKQVFSTAQFYEVSVTVMHHVHQTSMLNRPLGACRCCSCIFDRRQVQPGTKCYKNICNKKWSSKQMYKTRAMQMSLQWQNRKYYQHHCKSKCHSRCSSEADLEVLWVSLYFAVLSNGIFKTTFELCEKLKHIIGIQNVGAPYEAQHLQILLYVMLLFELVTKCKPHL